MWNNSKQKKRSTIRNMGSFYDGTKLLSLKDINGETPEIYICTTNRSGGKTTYFNRMVVKRFLATGKKFCLIYRYNYELDSVADKFFKDIGRLFFQDKFMRSERRASGIYHELYIGNASDDVKESGKSCGYAVSLNSANQLKKYSHLLSDTECMIFDEFMPEDNRYCSNEVSKFISIHVSIARGNGEQSRYLPVYMISNPVTIINPYYVELGISERLTDQTVYLRGNGFVLEQGYVKSASDAQKTSAFNRAFENNDYMDYAMESVYLNDNKAFIEKPIGSSRYICTLRYKGREYALREYGEAGIIYCDDRPDTTFKDKIAVTTSDHDINYVILKRNEYFISNLRFFFEKGCFRFKDLRCKEVVLKMLSY